MTNRGAWIRACAAAVFDARTMQLVVDPAIADLRHETCSLFRYLAVLKVIVLCIGGAGMSGMRCSFCRRPDSQVEKLVAGPWRLLAGRVYICDRCAAQTIEIMAHSGNNPPPDETAPLFRRILGRLHRSRRRGGRLLRAIVTPTG
jgi:hypothetical protein